MDGKLLIIVIFASVAQCSIAVPSAATFGLSGEDLANFVRIKSLQNKAERAKIAAITPIFDFAARFPYLRIHGVEITAANISISKIAEAKSKAKDAIQLILEATELAVGGSSSAVEVVRKAAYAKVDDTYSAINRAVELALDRNYTANRAGIIVCQLEVHKAVAELVEIYYGAIDIRLHTKDSDTLATILNAKKGSFSALERCVTAIFSAIKIIAVANTCKIENGLRIAEKLEAYRIQALEQDEVAFSHIFGLIRSIYLKSKLTKAHPLLSLNANQYALILSNYKFLRELNIIVGTIVDQMTNVRFGTCVGGDSDFTTIDAAEVEALAKLRAGSNVGLDSLLIQYPHADKEITAARHTFFSSASEVMGTFYGGIRSAVNSTVLTYPETLKQLATSRKILSSYATSYIQTYFKITGDGEHADEYVRAEAKSLRDSALLSLNRFSEKIIDSCEILARAVDAGKTSEHDFSEIRIKHVETTLALNDYTERLANARILLSLTVK